MTHELLLWQPSTELQIAWLAQWQRFPTKPESHAEQSSDGGVKRKWNDQ